MANAGESLQAETSETEPLKGDKHNRDVSEEDYAETATFCGCGYFGKFCEIRWRRDSDGGSNKQDERRESWATKTVKELKEISEKIAGPKWKNFIRRFSNNNRKMRKNLDFQYDLRSYGLNFDDGERFSGDFPARFTAPVVRNGAELSGADSSVL